MRKDQQRHCQVVYGRLALAIKVRNLLNNIRWMEMRGTSVTIKSDKDEITFARKCYGDGFAQIRIG